MWCAKIAMLSWLRVLCERLLGHARAEMTAKEASDQPPQWK